LSRWIGRILAPLAFVGLIAVIHTVTWYSPWMGWIGYVLVAGAAVIVVADLVAGSHSLLARPLATRPMIFIGKISYGLYLLHLPVYYIVEALIESEIREPRPALSLSESHHIFVAISDEDDVSVEGVPGNGLSVCGAGIFSLHVQGHSQGNHFDAFSVSAAIYCAAFFCGDRGREIEK
jgi:uncharacterized membrane protein